MILVLGWMVIQLVSINPLSAAPFRYPEAKHGKGELRYINQVPVLLVAGTPEEIGEQMGVLAIRPAAGLLTGIALFQRARTRSAAMINVAARTTEAAAQTAAIARLQRGASPLMPWLALTLRTVGPFTTTENPPSTDVECPTVESTPPMSVP